MRYFFLEFSQGTPGVEVQLFVPCLAFMWVVEPDTASKTLILKLFAPFYFDRLGSFLNIEIEVIEESEIDELLVLVVLKQKRRDGLRTCEVSSDNKWAGYACFFLDKGK